MIEAIQNIKTSLFKRCRFVNVKNAMYFHCLLHTGGRKRDETTTVEAVAGRASFEPIVEDESVEDVVAAVVDVDDDVESGELLWSAFSADDSVVVVPSADEDDEASETEETPFSFSSNAEADKRGRAKREVTAGELAAIRLDADVNCLSAEEDEDEDELEEEVEVAVD